MRNTHTSKQTSKCSKQIIRRIFRMFSTSFNKIILDAQISEYNKKLSTTPNAYDNSQGNKNLICTAPQSHNFHKNHPLSLVPRNYRIITVTEHICTSHSYTQSPVTHIVDHQPNVEEIYGQIKQ